MCSRTQSLGMRLQPSIVHHPIYAAIIISALSAIFPFLALTSQRHNCECVCGSKYWSKCVDWRRRELKSICVGQNGQKSSWWEWGSTYE